VYQNERICTESDYLIRSRLLKRGNCLRLKAVHATVAPVSFKNEPFKSSDTILYAELSVYSSST
jgi:hypothetical protein